MALKWEPITYAKGYKLYRKAEGGEYKLITTINKEKTINYVDTTFEYGKSIHTKLTTSTAIEK